MSADRRILHQPFDRSLIEEFLQIREFQSAQLLSDGRSKINYNLLLNDGQRYVLRLYSHGAPQREAYAMGLVDGLVPVPQELHRGENWSVVSFREGQLLEEIPQYTVVAAEALTRISSVSFPAPGWIESDGSLSPSPF